MWFGYSQQKSDVVWLQHNRVVGLYDKAEWSVWSAQSGLAIVNRRVMWFGYNRVVGLSSQHRAAYVQRVGGEVIALREGPISVQ